MVSDIKCKKMRKSISKYIKPIFRGTYLFFFRPERQERNKTLNWKRSDLWGHLLIALMLPKLYPVPTKCGKQKLALNGVSRKCDSKVLKPTAKNFEFLQGAGKSKVSK